MDLVIGLIIIFGGIFAYGYLQQSKWEKIYRIEIGKYYKMTPEKAAKKTRFDGTCYFDEMAEPINVGIRLSKGEKIYAAFENLSLMAYKRTGGFGFGGIFLRKKVAPAIYLRGGLGKFGLSKSLQADAVGTLYVTNKGVFYDGDKKNIKLAWDKIMRETINSDSIQLEKSNGSPILLNGNIDPKEAAKMTLTGQLYESL
tara:strand:+ start:5048 stop:5644 length:597 start_codon:yes stop_codon:yes gene_type:complete